ncbi:hypothetical protein F5Y04DRAFT_264993 [Hypomontagnella monticulosa]|nr:hypothetical protein F5Y04DRAFT_264993 [Hypomontagnella monticulosa]
MSREPERRLSTGGLPPVKTRERYVVEEAPSHDGTPGFTAWVRREIVEVPKGWSQSDFGFEDERPEWTLQIYDTTPGSDNPDHLKALAEKLFRELREEREFYDRGEPDSINVWGMPLAPDISEEERIAKCKAHLLAEAASREATGNEDLFISQPSHDEWQWAILIIDRPPELWNEDEGGFLAVYFGLEPDYLEEIEEEHGEDHEEPDTEVTRYTRTELRLLLEKIRGIL